MTGFITLTEAAEMLAQANDDTSCGAVEFWIARLQSDADALHVVEPPALLAYDDGVLDSLNLKPRIPGPEWRIAEFDFLKWAAENNIDLAIPAASVAVGADDTAKEPPVERQKRLQDRCNELKSRDVKAWKKQTAQEEGISTQMLDKILRRERIAVKSKPGTIEALKGVRKNNNGC